MEFRIGWSPTHLTRTGVKMGFSKCYEVQTNVISKITCTLVYRCNFIQYDINTIINLKNSLFSLITACNSFAIIHNSLCQIIKTLKISDGKCIMKEKYLLKHEFFIENVILL